MENYRLMTLNIDIELAKRFKRICKKQDRNMSIIIRDYIRKFVEENEQNQK